MALTRTRQPRLRLTALGVATALLAGLLGIAATAGTAQAGSNPTTQPWEHGGLAVGWGDNQFGRATVPASLTANAAANPVTAITGGYNHSLALTADGRVTAWGDNTNGQRDIPVSLNANAATNPVTDIAAGTSHSLALTADGQVISWGNPLPGMPMPASLNTNAATNPVVAVAAGAVHSLALTADGKVTAWGDNGSGQLSIPVSLNANAATNPVTAIAAGIFHSLAITADGQVTVWGNSGVPMTVPASLNTNAATNPVTAVAAGVAHSLALTADGTVTAWGDNGTGRLNIPPALNANAATNPVTAIAAGDGHSLALTADGTITVWGNNGSPWTLTPAVVSQHTVTAISASPLATFAIVTGAPATLSGTPVEGQVLSAALATGAGVNYQWDLDGTPIAGATTSSLELTDPSWLGHHVRATVTDSDGIPHRTPPVTIAGTFSDPTVGISGTPQVGQTLKANTEATPGADAISYIWTRDNDTSVLSTDRSYTPVAADLGRTLTVTATLTRAGYVDAVVSDTSAPITTVFTAPNVTVTGAFKAGETLTATATPAADTTSYTWRRGSLIVGTGATYTTTDADEGHELLVTAELASAHTTGATVSTHTSVIATRKAPTLALSVNKKTVRQGQSVTITWDSNRATALTGNWGSAIASSGTATLRQTTVGTKTWTLKATNANGTTTATTLTVVTLPAKKLTVRVPKKITSGKRTRFTVAGLAPGEKFTATQGPRSRILKADSSGKRTFTMRALIAIKQKKTVRFTITGSQADRTVATKVTITPKKKARPKR